MESGIGEQIAGPIFAWLLALPRPLGLLGGAGFGLGGLLPWRWRLFFVGLTAVVISQSAPMIAATLPPAIDGQVQVQVYDAWYWAWLSLQEGIVGLSWGLTIAVFLRASWTAGELVVLQAGLQPQEWVIPGQENTEDDGINPWSRLQGGLALAVFLAIDGPMQAVLAVIESYRVIPWGTRFGDVDSLRTLIGTMTQATALALRLAAPLGFALVCASLTLGLLNRMSASLGQLILSIPIRLLLFFALAPLGFVVTALIWEQTWRSWLQLIRSVSP